MRTMDDHATTTLAATCNICGSGEFGPFAGRAEAQCTKCFSVERTRGIALILDRLGVMKKGGRAIHFAPERGLALHLKAVMGDGYEGYDLFPELFHPSIGVKKFNLIDDVASLPTNAYDLVLHVHVVEHLPAWPVQTLRHLHRSLKPGGIHLVCFPIYKTGRYAAEFGEIEAEVRNRKFGQLDHLHRFARADLANTMGAVFDINEHNSGFGIDQHTAQRHNINASEVMETVFAFRKEDWLLNL